MLLTGIGVILASVFLEGFTGPLQHTAHNYLIHRGAAPAQRTAVWVLTALCLPAVFQTGFTKSVSAREHHWLTENMATNWTGKVILKMSASGGHSSPQGFDDKAASEAPPTSLEHNLILTSGISVNTLAPKGVSCVVQCCVEHAHCTFSNKHHRSE